MTRDGPWGGHNNGEPGSPRRVIVLLAVLATVAAAAHVGLVTPMVAALAAVSGVATFLFVEYQVENQMRRDLQTDLAQALHDGDLEAEDLRRARGYVFVEERVDEGDGVEAAPTTQRTKNQ